MKLLTLRSILPSLWTALLLAATPSTSLADLRLDGGAERGWDADRWRAQVDGVMGGKSSGSLAFEESNAILRFSGEVVLDGGGFSSVRKEAFEGGAVDLTPYAGVVVTLETTEGYDGDGTRAPLGLHLQFHDTVSRYMGYASAFAIPLAGAVGEETSVYLPMSSFDRGSRMGFVCDDCQIDFSSVDEMDIYVLFQKGQFDVRVKEIKAVDTPRSYASPVIDIRSTNEIKTLIEATIRSGGGLYDYGYMEICIAIYRSTLNTLLGTASGNNENPAVVSTAIKGMICQGLQRAELQRDSKIDTAWTLRYTMDGILEELGFLDPGQRTGWRPTATIDENMECSAVTSGAYIRTVTSEPTRRPITGMPTTENPTTASPTLAPVQTISLTTEPTVLPTMRQTPSLSPPLASTTAKQTNFASPSPINTDAPSTTPITSPTHTPNTTFGPTIEMNVTTMQTNFLPSPPFQTTPPTAKQTISPTSVLPATLEPSLEMTVTFTNSAGSPPPMLTDGSVQTPVLIPPKDFSADSQTALSPATVKENNYPSKMMSATASSSSSSLSFAGVFSILTMRALVCVGMALL